MDRGYRYVRACTRSNLRVKIVSLSTLFSWQHQDQHADTAKEASSVTIMQLYRVSI
jgi:hypothetical protein